MGIYLNPDNASFEEALNSEYYVDKSMLISKITPLLRTKQKYICITRPRRFGKSMAADMLVAYYSQGCDSAELFENLKVAQTTGYLKHLNKHNVIFMNMSELPEMMDGTPPTYKDYIRRVKNNLMDDLIEAYPNCNFNAEMALWDALKKIRQKHKGEKFIFVMDEWDFIFHQKFITEEDKELYIKFLTSLLKGQTYVEGAYITGILPISKYSSGSELNCFTEYTMATLAKFSEDFGFIESEVDDLYQQYMKNTPNALVTREELTEWYDGYFTSSGERLYNPRSVVLAFTNNQVADYWTSSGPYDEIFYYIKNNVDDVQDEIAQMIAGEPVRANVKEYAAAGQEINTKDKIFSAMVVYGFLTTKDGCVSIPNRELMNKFVDMVNNEDSLGYVYRLAKESERMLAATKAGDLETMREILEQAHNTETDMKGYNSEAELSAVIKLLYLAARDDYRIQREEKSGTGFVDYVLYPKTRLSDDCIIIELKVDSTAEDAIEQIKSRHYTQEILGKLGEKPLYIGRILAVGVGYFKNDKAKKHDVKVEILREKI